MTRKKNPLNNSLKEGKVLIHVLPRSRAALLNKINYLDLTRAIVTDIFNHFCLEDSNTAFIASRLHRRKLGKTIGIPNFFLKMKQFYSN